MAFINKKQTTFAEIFLLAAFVLIIRMVFEGAIPFFQDHFSLNFNDTLSQLLRNYPLALLMVVLDFLCVWALRQWFEYGRRPMSRMMAEVAGLTVIAFGSALLIRVMQSDTGAQSSLFFNHTFWYTSLTSFVLNGIIIAFIDIYSYYWLKQKEALAAERDKKNKARFQYQQLKQQLNPHFLFNSLNSLDYLIHTDAPKASEYVRRLAAVYRYFLNIEAEAVVPLSQEVDFVKLYVALLEQRFDTGLQVTIDVLPADMRKKIVPCGLQLLVENATKHNVISKDKPLYINIFSNGDFVVVANNIQPKIHNVESTGLGLNNIQGQYQSMFGKDILIVQTPKSYEVRLPLIS